MKKLLIVAFVILTNSVFAQTFMAQTDPPILGKVCPDFSMSVITANGNEKNLTLSELRGKIVVMEFWATYCAPCIPSLKHFDRLQNQFGDAVKFIAISEENRDKVDAFIAKKGFKNITYAMDWGRKLNDMFYHHFIPHTVVIDQDGIVQAFTSPDEVDQFVIGKMLNREPVAFTMKHEYQEASYSQASVGGVTNYDQPIIVNKPKNQVYKVEFSNYKEGYSTEFVKESAHEYRFINCPLTLIYQILYDQKTSRVILDVNDRSKYTFDQQNLYCLDLSVPEYVGKTIQEVGLQQLEMLFPLKSKIENRNQKVFAIQKSELSGAIASKDSVGIQQKGLTIKDLVNYLESNPQLVDNLPVVNETGMPNETVIDLDWFQNYPDSIENRLRTLGLHGEVKMADITCLLLYESRLVSKNE
ncbi:MAG: TlpA family protein disulfide reductase [Arcicella sp.]|jgi:thiol-disulfide isomerase/thioredoxin|nr:TlpA family protein disulfide reductase [Arcicella sp.]